MLMYIIIALLLILFIVLGLAVRDIFRNAKDLKTLKNQTHAKH
jgi:hypothetical protein